MALMTGAELLVESLAREGIERVFSIPGGQLIPIYDAVNDHPGLDMIVPRHEGASALMACGYSLASGAPAVVMSTVGAGLIYEAGGLLYAWRERLPVMSISPQVQSYRIKPNQESLQACEHDEILRPFTKFRAIVYHYPRMPQLIGRALRMACSPEPGPVHLDVPMDILFGFRPVGKRRLKKFFPPGFSRFQGEVVPGRKSIDNTCGLIGSARRPLVMAGRGIERARAGAELAALLQALPAPMLTSSAAFGSVKSSYPRRLGPAALWSSDDARRALSESDLVLLLEADEETARLVRVLVELNPSLKVIQSGDLAAVVGSVVPVDEGLLGSPKAVLRELCSALAGGTSADLDREWCERLAGMRPSLEKALISSLGMGPRIKGIVSTIRAVSAAAGPEDFIVCEGALPAGAAMAALEREALHGVTLLPDDSIPGAGLPLCLGIKAWAPDANVFLVSEASMVKRHSRELQTASRYGLGVNAFVFQDREKKPEEEVNFAALAAGLGVDSKSVLDPEEEVTERVVRDNLSARGGTLYDASEWEPA